jgi:hypothetical protein
MLQIRRNTTLQLAYSPYLIDENLRLIHAANRSDMFRHLFAGPA